MAELKSLLSDPNFLARASAGNILADALRSSDFLKTAAVASREGNDMAAPNTFIDDLSKLNYYELDAKWGREVAENRGEFQKEAVRQQAVRAKPRSALDIGIDTGIAATTAGVGMLGGIAAATVGVAGAVNKFGTGGRETRLSEGSTYIARKTAELTGWMTGLQSEEIQQRGELIDIEAQLDQQDSTDQMNRKIAAGYDPKLADYERIGRDFLDFGDRFYKDPAVAANLITGALGSLWPSAKMAQAGVRLAEKLAKKTTSKLVNRAAGTVGSSLGIGLAEASGTYSDTVNFVLELSPEDMQNSEEYRALIQQGKDPEQAQRIVASSTATEAAGRQLPVAATLGLVAARFNTNPFKAFKGRSTIGYFREASIQAFEEGGQAFSSTYNQNVAVQRQIDEDTDIGAGLGASLGEGIFAGAGMAGVIGAPSQARVVARGAAVGTIAAADLIAQGVAKVAKSETAAFLGEKAGIALDVTSAAAQKVAKVAEPVTKPVAKVVVKGAQVVSEKVIKPVVQKAEDFNLKPNVKLQLEVLEASRKAVDAAPDNQVIAAVDKLIMDLTTTQASKMTDEAVLQAAQDIQALNREVKNLEDDTAIEVLRMLANSEFLKIKERFQAIRKTAAKAAPDLNQTQTTKTAVTKATIEETLDVAALDPAKVNPEHIRKILKSEDHGLDDDQIKILEVAAAVSLAVNTHRNAQVEVSSNESIALSKKPAYRGKDAPEVIGFEKTAQSLQITGYTDNRGKSLRSISDFVADFIAARQGDGTVADTREDEGFISTETLAKNFGMLVEHMRNKIEAFNKSIASQDKKGHGTTERFRSIVGGNRMVNPGGPGGATGVFVHTSSPKSIATAEATANDARVAAEVYNILVRAFPKQFPGGVVSIPILSPTTTAVEASEGASSAEQLAIAQAEAVAKEVVATEETEAEIKQSILDETTTAVDETISPQAQIDEEADTLPSDQVSQEVTKIQDDAPSLDTAPTAKFDKTFLAGKGEDLNYADGQQLLDLLSEGESKTTEGYLTFASKIFDKLMSGMNERLATITKGSKDERTIKQQLLDGDELLHLRDFKNTMMVNPETGEYNPELMSIAVVAMIDWMSSVRSADPSSRALRETLNRLGVDLQSLNSEDFHNILHGVSPRFVAETLADRIIKMWGKQVDSKGQMVDARGAVEGLVKEMLEVLAAKTDFISIHRIPTTVDGRKGNTFTINVKNLRETQKDIGINGQNSILKLLTPEEHNGPSIGKRIEHVARKNRRGTVDLSKAERRALRAEQDVPHKLAKGISELISVIGYKIYSKMLGLKGVDHLAKNHPLRNSIEGKNLSILRDWEDAHAVTDQLQGDNQETPVYFRITITKAGRHQHSGINSQNNKTLRVMVSPTNSTLDMTKQDDIDGFWLTVAQASGIFKVENVLHEKILAEIQGEMVSKYGDAIKLLENYLNTGKLDENALFEATGEIEMEVLNAIFAVADLNNVSRKTNALTEFYTTLGFELDGKTDGPSHMMNNFGQGLLTLSDYLNFQRVGMFLGDTLQTLNNFFADQTMKDLYNEASVRGQNTMYSQMAHADPSTKAALYASARFAEHFGDFKLGDDGLPEMTRDTLKNPMTKTVYGSGLFSVARGITEDMVMGFYEAATNMPKGAKPSEYFGYAEFEADFFLLFDTKYPSGVDWTQSYISKRSVEVFTNIVTEGIGAMIANASKEVIGEPITRVADLIVFITNVQTQFMVNLYNKKLLELAEKRAKEGKIGRSRLKKDPKDGSANTGPGIQRQLTVQDFIDLKVEIQGYGPTYDNGVQTLAVGAFSPQPSNQQLSSTMEGELNMKSTMSQPELASVKAIPYLTQGRGDAMVVNTIFGENNAPEDMMAVHDGFYVPINKIKQYSRQVNEAVMRVWDRDVIGDVVTDFEGFLAKVSDEDANLLAAAMRETKAKPYDTTVKAKTVEQLMATLKVYHRRNQARKKVFRVIPVSVDHLGGAQEAATRNKGDGTTLDRHDINALIADKMGVARPTENVKAVEDDLANADREAQENHSNRLRAAAGMRTAMNEAAERDNTEITLPSGDRTPSSIMITDTDTILKRLKQSSNRLTIKRAVELLSVFLREDNFRVVYAGMGIDLIKYYDQVHGEGAAEKIGITGKNMPRGWVDIDTNTIWTVSENHETLVHEMIHLVTYKKMLAHFDGSQTNAAVTRLETLMEEFMAIDFSNKGKALQTAVNGAKAAILLNQTDSNPGSRAAALNEFIAWTLSNAALTKELKTQDTILVQMAKKVLILIKRILGSKIPSDMYSHILFNTVLLHETWVTEAAKVGETIETPAEEATPEEVGDGGDTNGVDNDNNGDGDDAGRGNQNGGVTPPAAKRTNFWINLMRKKLADIKGLDAGDPTRDPRVTQFRRYRNTALEAVKVLDFGGFVMSEYEKHTFRSIHMVLATEMRLNTQSSIALNQMFEHITTHLKPSMFGKGRNAQELYSTVMDLLGSTKNDEQVSDAMAVLMALSQTSELFRTALDQIPVPGNKKVSDGSLNGFLTAITGNLMNKTLGTINIADSGAKELLDVLARNLLREDTEREYTLLRGLMGSLDKADKFLSGALNELAERSAAVNTRMNAEDRSLLTKLVTSTVAASTAFLNADRASILAEGAKRLTHMGVALDHAVFLREFISEVVGADSTNAEVMMMLDRTNYAVQAIRQDYKEHLPVIFQDAFKNGHPNDVQWAAFHRVLAGLDFATLFDLSNPERAFNLLKDASLLSSKTVDAENVISKTFDKVTAENILEKAKQLAGYMNHKGAGQQLLQNAHAINKLAGQYDESMTPAIDTLISLYALESADQVQKDAVIEMYDNNPQAVQNLVTYIQALNKEEDLKEITEGARMQGRKGWIPDHGKKNAQIIIERDDKGDKLIKMGYVRVGDASADSKFSTVKRGYYTTTVKQGTSYSQGVLQSVQGTYRGVNAVTGISVAPNVSGVITGVALDRITSHLNANKIADNMEVLSPVHDEAGLVWAYERIINPDMMAKYTQPRSNLALMLGAWAGRQVEEKSASQYNRELITELKRIYDERKSNDDKLFVDISDPNIKDEVYKESWRVISPDTRMQIEDIFEGKGFFVRKDMMNLALGYNDPSIVDVWTGKTRMPKKIQTVIQAAAKATMGNKAVTILSKGEAGIQEVVSAAKDIIVVRSLIVPYMNTQANVFQLLTRGVGLQMMLDGYKDKMAELERFNENIKRLMVIDTNIALAGNNVNEVRILNSQKQVILDENKRMSIAPLIEAGQYKNISEGITALDVDLMDGKFAEWVENRVNKLPDNGIRTIAKYGLLSKDTALYKAANKAVQYGDFLAKAIYYDHLTQIKGESHEGALKKINEEYVNFSILPGRTRSALESVGGTWFMSFKIRTMKVALNVMRENPARALILVASGIGEFGSPVNDNLATVILQDRFDYSVGWDMLLGSPELNPWAQMWGWT